MDEHSREEQVPQPNLSDLKPDHNFSMDELLKAKSKLKAGKSPVLNGLHSEQLKWEGSALDERLLSLFNSCWMGSSQIPREWIDAEVVSIYKREGRADDVINYRGILLLETIGSCTLVSYVKDWQYTFSISFRPPSMGSAKVIRPV